MFSEFLDRNVIVVGMLVLLAAAGAVLGVIGRLRARSAFGVAALLIALACAGIGVVQRQALVNASAFAASVPGLSKADRARIVASKISDAEYALEVSLVCALLPLVAGGAALFRNAAARTPS